MEKQDGLVSLESAAFPNIAPCFLHEFLAHSHTAFHQGSYPCKTAHPAPSSSRYKRARSLDRKPGRHVFPLLKPGFQWESSPNLLACTDQLESSPLRQESCSSRHPTS